MSLTAERPAHTVGMAQILTDRRAAGTLPSTLHVLLDIGLADDCAGVRATLGALAAFGGAADIRVHLGTAGGPRCLGALDPLATNRALSRSTRAGLPWLVVTTEVTDLRDGPDTLCLAIVQAWDRHRGVEA